METIAVANQKGGAGKTSTAAALWAYCNAHGKRALAIDLDAQGNLSLLADADTDGATVFGALQKEISLGDAIQHAEAGDIVAASPLQNTADTVLQMLGKERRLAEALDTLPPDAYDFVIIDTPPHMGVLTLNALAAADRVIIPAQADVFSLHGIGQLEDSAEAVRAYAGNPALRIDGILLTRYNDRANVSKAVRDAMQGKAEAMGGRLYDATIRESVKVKEAQIARKDIFTYAPGANVAEDYAAFCREFLEGIR